MSSGPAGTPPKPEQSDSDLVGRLADDALWNLGIGIAAGLVVGAVVLPRGEHAARWQGRAARRHAGLPTACLARPILVILRLQVLAGLVRFLPGLVVGLEQAECTSDTMWRFRTSRAVAAA